MNDDRLRCMYFNVAFFFTARDSQKSYAVGVMRERK